MMPSGHPDFDRVLPARSTGLPEVTPEDDCGCVDYRAALEELQDYDCFQPLTAAETIRVLCTGQVDMGRAVAAVTTRVGDIRFSCYSRSDEEALKLFVALHRIVLVGCLRQGKRAAVEQIAAQARALEIFYGVVKSQSDHILDVEWLCPDRRVREMFAHLSFNHSEFPSKSN